MPTHYVMKEMPDLQGKGERVTYPQMVLLGQSSTRELAEYISLRSGFSPGMVEGIISNWRRQWRIQWRGAFRQR